MLTSLLPALARKPLEYLFMVAGKNLGNYKKRVKNSGLIYRMGRFFCEVIIPFEQAA